MRHSPQSLPPQDDATQGSVPYLLKFLAVNAAIGVGLGWALLAGLILTDPMKIGTLIFSSAAPLVPLAMLAAVFGVTLGAAVMGTAVLSLPVERPTRRPTPYDPESDRPRAG